MTTPTPTGERLIETLGGPQTINTIVGALYFHITCDPRVSHFFRSVSLERILMHQRAFFTMALSGAPVYNGRSLAEAHADLVARHGLTHAHFDIVMDHLKATLSELDIDPTAAREVERRVAATRPLIFGDDTPVDTSLS